MENKVVRKEGQFYGYGSRERYGKATKAMQLAKYSTPTKIGAYTALNGLLACEHAIKAMYMHSSDESEELAIDLCR